MNREVMSLVFEFLISVMVLGGGGFLVYYDKAPELAAASIGAVIAYWFSNRQAEKQAKREAELKQIEAPSDTAER